MVTIEEFLAQHTLEYCNYKHISNAEHIDNALIIGRAYSDAPTVVIIIFKEIIEPNRYAQVESYMLDRYNNRFKKLFSGYSYAFREYQYLTPIGIFYKEVIPTYQSEILI